MKAIINDAVVADAPQADLIFIEGNYYIPSSSISAACSVTARPRAMA